MTGARVRGSREGERSVRGARGKDGVARNLFGVESELLMLLATGVPRS